jgi:hypothetical protein
MLIFVFGISLTAALLVGLGLRARSQTAELGAMSNQWINNHNASQPASSM